MGESSGPTGYVQEARESHEHAPRYRSWVGPPEIYDRVAAMQFNILTSIGLREHHFLLDIGCGSLRAGRLLIPYLLPGRYYGIEPEQSVLREGIENELGRDAIRIKRPTFSYDDRFRLSVFGRDFDVIVAHSIFTHAAVGQIRTCLAEAKSVLRDDGTMAATFIARPHDYEGSGWTRGVAGYRPKSMIAMIGEAGLDVAPLDWPHPNERQRWLLIRHDGAAEVAGRLTPPRAV